MCCAAMHLQLNCAHWSGLTYSAEEILAGMKMCVLHLQGPELLLSCSPLVNVGPTSASHLCHLQLSWRASCRRSLAPGLVLPFRRDEQDPWLVSPVVFGGVWVGHVCFGLPVCSLYLWVAVARLNR